MTHVDFCCGLLLRNLLQQQTFVCNHAKTQLQQNAQQTWLQATQTMMVFYAGVLLSDAFLNDCKKKLISSNEAFGVIDG